MCVRERACAYVRVRTRMRATAYPGEDPETLPTPESITDAFMKLAEPACMINGKIINV